MKMSSKIVLATLVASVIGCATALPPASMRGAAVNAGDPAPDLKRYSEKTPGVGEQKLITRTFYTQPPLIPHGIEKYVPLTAEENACMDCHQTQELRGQKVPQIGKSHFVANATDKAGKPVLEMTRFQCDSCHVPQVDAQPLVENRFIGATR
ncbi:MAG: hypothetical protein RIR00_1820 [Pseudomonadota bacterium]|jgi:cytochrome c-type protein NapB